MGHTHLPQVHAEGQRKQNRCQSQGPLIGIWSQVFWTGERVKSLVEQPSRMDINVLVRTPRGCTGKTSFNKAWACQEWTCLEASSCCCWCCCLFCDPGSDCCQDTLKEEFVEMHPILCYSPLLALERLFPEEIKLRSVLGLWMKQI